MRVCISMLLVAALCSDCRKKAKKPEKVIRPVHVHQVKLDGAAAGSTFVNNAEFREWIWRAFEADAVDMETAAVAHVAALNKVPFLAFRSLSDLAGGGPGANEIRIFGRLAADNSAAWDGR